MISCDADDLMEAAKCIHQCIPASMQRAVQIYLLKGLSGAYQNATLDKLVNDARCFHQCIPSGMQMSVMIHLLCQISPVQTTAPTDSDWIFDFLDDDFGSTVFAAGVPLPQINQYDFRSRKSPIMDWTYDGGNVGEGDIMGTFGPGETVEAQIAWVVEINNPPGRYRVSDFSASKFVTHP